MNYSILLGCRAAATWEQQAICSPAIGNAGSCSNFGDPVADGLHHRRKGNLPTAFFAGAASAAGAFPPITYGNAVHLLNRNQIETDNLFFPVFL